jgi:hypothetical protein
MKKTIAKHSEDAQITLVLKHLLEKKEITPLVALHLYGCYRLGAIIFDLRAEGHNISTEVIEYKKENGRRGKYAVYRLEA